MASRSKKIRVAQSFWEQLKLDMQRDKAPYVVVSPPDRWQTGPIGAVQFFGTKKAALINVRNGLKLHGHHSQLYHLEHGALVMVPWEKPQKEQDRLLNDVRALLK